MSERKPGWYWIKVHGSDEWECAHWQNEGWWLAGDDMHVGNTMAAVGPRIPTPSEPWQCEDVETKRMGMEMLRQAGNRVIHYGCDKREWDDAVCKALSAAPKPEDS